jgi:hypothetical protein
MDNVTAHSTTNPSSANAASYVDAYVPPTAQDPANPVTITSPVSTAPMTPQTPTPDTVPAAAASTTPPAKTGAQSEELEDQNIFYMLGVLDGTPEQRESFLDELQQVIWEDFLEYDVKLLITKEEQGQLDTILSSNPGNELEKQEKIVVFLEKLIPDLEEIMLEKALELKEEMIRERVKGMKEYYKEKPESLAQITKAEEMMNVGKWYTAATLLNSIR